MVSIGYNSWLLVCDLTAVNSCRKWSFTPTDEASQPLLRLTANSGQEREEEWSWGD